MKFDIIEYLSGLTSFLFDRAVLVRIAMDRDVLETEEYLELDTKTKELLRADLLFEAYTSPSVWASASHSHGGFSSSTGSQSVSSQDKERIYEIFMGIYKKYNDTKADSLPSGGTLQWLE